MTPAEFRATLERLSSALGAEGRRDVVRFALACIAAESDHEDEASNRERQWERSQLPDIERAREERCP